MFKVALWTLEKTITKRVRDIRGHLGSLKAELVREEAHLSQSLGLPSQFEYCLWRDLGSLRRNGGIFQRWIESFDPLGTLLNPRAPCSGSFPSAATSLSRETRPESFNTPGTPMPYWVSG